MKKLLLLLLVLPFFISCSNDDKEEERFTVPVASGIIGTWRVTQVNNGLGYADVPESTSTKTKIYSTPIIKAASIINSMFFISIVFINIS